VSAWSLLDSSPWLAPHSASALNGWSGVEWSKALLHGLHGVVARVDYGWSGVE
jgi:hypothetical protein